MKALWVDEGNDPDWVKVAAHQMTSLFFALRDPRIDKPYLRNVIGRSYRPGVYAVSNWPEFSGDGLTFAQKVVAKVKPLMVNPSNPKVQLDIEEHDPDKILDALTEFRAELPKQDLSWTMESFQGGWMTPEFVAGVIRLRVRVVPQLYKGKMADLDEPDPEIRLQALLDEQVAQDMALKDLLKAGFPYELVTGFYDAATLPFWWDGFAFTMGRLP